MKKFDVCVVGGCSVDITHYADAGQTKVFFGGKGANQAVACSRAGASTCIVTKLGEDKYTDLIVGNLKKAGVTTFVDIVSGEQNDIAKITIRDGDNSIERSGKIITYFDDELIDKYKQVILASKYVILQNKASYDFTKSLIEFCYENGIKTILTPTKPQQISVVANENNAEILNKVTYICANEKEAVAVFGENSVENIVKKHKNQLIITLGGKGLVYSNDKEVVKLPAITVKQVVDTTGAGDTFCGNFVANLAVGMPFDEAVYLAQFASAYKIGYESAQTGMPTKQELEEFVRGYHGNRAKI